MQHKLIFLTLLAASATLIACDTGKRPEATVTSAESADMQDFISGSVTYRERMALSPTAELNIQLQDVSLADVAAKVLAEKNSADVGQVPIEFKLPFDPALIEERNSYAVRATIRDQGKLLFTTDTHYPVLTRGNGRTVDLLLVRAVSSPPATASLTDTQWVLQSLNGETVEATADKQPMYLRLSSEGSIAQGYAGCNQFTGSWQLVDGRIQYGPMAVTMMACADGMDREQAFLQALQSAERHEITGSQLILYQGDKAVLEFSSETLPSN